jgi:hypothetical protein
MKIMFAHKFKKYHNTVAKNYRRTTVTIQSYTVLSQKTYSLKVWKILTLVGGLSCVSFMNPIDVVAGGGWKD